LGKQLLDRLKTLHGVSDVCGEVSFGCSILCRRLHQ
jgi:hypothetical protein